jgi:multiple sugar transport system permease protein
MFRQVPLASAFVHSGLIAGGATVLGLSCALPGGYALARYTFPGRRVVLLGVLSVMMFSPIVIIIALFQVTAGYGLVDRWYAVSIADAAFSLPFCMWIMTSYFESIPRELDEAAMIDGASAPRIFLRVLLPLALPGITTVIIFAFVQAWNDFLVATTLLSTQNEFPLPVTIFNFIGEHGVQWQYICGSVLLGSLPVLILFLFIQRFLVRGLTAGALK